MPQRVLNFWISGLVDGRATPINAGPQADDGGFNLVVLIRENGGISDKRVRLIGRATSDGRLHLEVSAEGLEQQPLLHKTGSTLTYSLHTNRT